MMKYFLLLLLLCMPASAFAEDKEVASPEKFGKTYSPDYCEFSATFPSDAYISRRCEDTDQKKCYDLVSFTKVFDLTATIKVDIICNRSTPQIYEQLTLDAMKTTVKAMTKGIVIEAFDVNARQADTYRQAGLLGKGREGVQDSMYIAQLWSGKKSMMSVEAQLIGEPMEAADSMFAQILRSIGQIPVDKTDEAEVSDVSPDVSEDATSDAADETVPEDQGKRSYQLKDNNKIVAKKNGVKVTIEKK